jgi:hypothetical protein
MAFRLYYKADKADPTFPSPAVCPEMTIPRERPKKQETTGALKEPSRAIHPAAASHTEEADESLDVEAILAESKPTEDRRQLLKEVREHLDLLKEFEGVISDEDIAKRKRELFMALPPAPSPLHKKAKV